MTKYAINNYAFQVDLPGGAYVAVSANGSTAQYDYVVNGVPTPSGQIPRDAMKQIATILGYLDGTA